MKELEDIMEKWDGRGIFLLRLDYGYSAPCRADLDADCSAAPASELASIASSLNTRGIMRLTSPHYAFSARRRNSGGGELLSGLVKAGAVIETRFPKTFNNIKRYFETEKVPFSSHDARNDGSLPPLYKDLRRGSELFNLHLAYEWETGLSMARGSSVVVEAGRMISKSAGTLSAGALALQMGITAGAAASYLKWMEEAALVRKVDKGYALRHEGLYSLFGVQPRRGEKGFTLRKSDPMDLD